MTAPKPAKSRNPFYMLLVIVGTVFAVTAIAYCVMSVIEVRASAGLGDGGAAHPLLTWLRQHGDMAMLVELAVLSVLTFAAIGTDGYWDQQPNQE